jgi:hypothetical protein
MNVEIGAEAALFPEKEYVNGIPVAVHCCLTGRWGMDNKYMYNWSTTVYVPSSELVPPTPSPESERVPPGTKEVKMWGS